MTRAKNNPATLTVYFNKFGVSFVHVTPGYVLHDWGTVTVKGPEKHRAILRVVRMLVTHHQPQVLVFEDVVLTRAPRIRTALRALARYAAHADVPCAVLTRDDVRAAGAPFDAKTKHALNHIVAATFPALRFRIPRKRRAWDPEAYGQGVFDAAAFAITYFVRTCGFRPQTTPKAP